MRNLRVEERKAMISKNQFFSALDALAKQDKEDSMISTHLQCICPESHVFYSTKYAQQALLTLLEIAVEDEDSWISYWLYDLQCGEKYKPGSVKIYGKNTRLKTPGDLWRILQKKV